MVASSADQLLIRSTYSIGTRRNRKLAIGHSVKNTEHLWTYFIFLQGVWGFILGGLTWFAIPFSMATTMGLAYLGMSSAQGAPLLSDEDVASGLAAPLVAQKLLGTTGEYAILFLILMAVMSTGSAEVIAVASIIIYDIYQVIIINWNTSYLKFVPENRPCWQSFGCLSVLASALLQQQYPKENRQILAIQTTVAFSRKSIVSLCLYNQ